MNDETDVLGYTIPDGVKHMIILNDSGVVTEVLFFKTLEQYNKKYNELKREYNLEE